MNIHKQIELYFKELTLPVWVLGVDIELYPDEIIYKAVQKNKGVKSVLKFVVRNKTVFLIDGYKK